VVIPDLTKRQSALVAACAVLVGAVVFAVVALTGDDKAELPKELSKEALQAAMENPEQMREKMREAFERQDLTDQQRAQLRQNIRQVMFQQMNQRLDEYFTADKSARQAILDRHLDEMQKRMKEWQQNERRNPRDGENRRSSAGTGRPGDGSGRGPGMGSGGPGGGRGRGGFDRDGRGGIPPSEMRKQRSESRDPDAHARRMAYFTALRQRAEERGIEMSSFRGPPGRPR